MSQEVDPTPIQVPFDRISPDALAGLIAEFILREGTDYGRNEVELETKQGQIRKQLEKGDVVIVYDPASESVTLLTKREFERAHCTMKPPPTLDAL